MASGKGRRNVGDALENFKRLKNRELEAWAKAMVEASEGTDIIPEGWYTEQQLAEKFGFTRTGIRAHIRRVLEAGKIERKKFRIKIPSKDDRRYSVYHYKMKK